MKPGLSFVVAVVVVSLTASAPCGGPPDNVSQKSDGQELKDRIARLEATVARLERQIGDERLSSRLQGKWIEDSYVRSGEEQVIDQDEPDPIEVVWVLTSDASASGRWILEAEPKSVNYGRFAVDTSKSPAWIDLQVFVERDARSYPVRGIVRYTYNRAEIALPANLFEGDTFLDPPRPTSFESTAENGYAVHKLIRESYQRTGVW